MIRVILHIGRNKSGTTSLQRYLYNNRIFLEQSGFAYPDAYIRVNAHHELPNVFVPRHTKTLSSEVLNDRVQEHRERLIQKLSDGSLTYIISSEAFQNMSPWIARQLFPPDHFQVMLVCYFRDQVGYLASAYNQKVHATTYDAPVEQFYNQVFSANYNGFSEKWTRYFPDYYFNLFQKGDLWDGDLIKDFFSRVLLLSPPNTSYAERNNRSLTRHVLSTKREINRKVNRGELEVTIRPASFYSLLPDLSCGPHDGQYVIDPKMRSEIEQSHMWDNKKFFAQFLPGGSFEKSPDTVEGDCERSATDFDVSVALKKIARMAAPKMRSQLIQEYRELSEDCLPELDISGNVSNYGDIASDRGSAADDLFDRLKAGIPTTALCPGRRDANILMIRRMFAQQLISAWSLDQAFEGVDGSENLLDETRVAISLSLLDSLNNADMLLLPGEWKSPPERGVGNKPDAEWTAMLSMADYVKAQLVRNRCIEFCELATDGSYWSGISQLGCVSVLSDKSDFAQHVGELTGLDIKEVIHLPEKLPEIVWDFGIADSGDIHYSPLADLIGSRDRSGEVFLVDAGVPGRIAAHWIRQKGGSVLDIGHCLQG